MKIWITGLAGFLGSHLADELRALGHKVCGNDNELCSIIPLDGYKVDCRHYTNMRKHLMNFSPDVLIHCAATAHEGLSNFSPSFITRNIYEASVTTFSAAISAGVKRMIFMSSMARYGVGYISYTQGYEKCGSPFDEGYDVNAIDPYGIAKVASEQTLKALCDLHGIEYVIAVPHNIIGPRQRYNDPFRNVASIMINRALQGKPLIIYGDGKQKRCFSPIKDCLDSLVKMIDAQISGEIINIGPDGGEITILELAEIINDLTCKNVEIQHWPDRPNEVKEAWCSSDKARRLLGYKAKQPLRECLAEMVLHIKEHGTKEFDYSFPLEIVNAKTPKTWTEKKI